MTPKSYYRVRHVASGTPPDMIGEAKDRGKGRRMIFGLASTAAIVVLFFLMPGLSSNHSHNHSGSNGRVYGASRPAKSVAFAPTRQGGVAVLGATATRTVTPTPSPTFTPSPASTIAATGAKAQSAGLPNDPDRPTPTPGPLFKLKTPPTPAPPDQVKQTAAGYDWIAYEDGKTSFLYPNEWWIDVSLDDQHLGIRGDGVWLDVIWSETDEDITWAFKGDNRYSAEFLDIAAETDESYIEALVSFAPATEMSQFDQAAIGNFPTISSSVYELVLDGNWTDADELMVAGGVVLCGPQRICDIAYHMADHTFTVDDWALLENFARNLIFTDDAPLPASILTPPPTPENRPKRLKPPSRYSRRKASRATAVPTPRATATPIPTATIEPDCDGGPCATVLAGTTVHARPSVNGLVIRQHDSEESVGLIGQYVYAETGAVWYQSSKGGWIEGRFFESAPDGLPLVDVPASRLD